MRACYALGVSRALSNHSKDELGGFGTLCGGGRRPGRDPFCLDRLRGGDRQHQRRRRRTAGRRPLCGTNARRRVPKPRSRTQGTHVARRARNRLALHDDLAACRRDRILMARAVLGRAGGSRRAARMRRLNDAAVAQRPASRRAQDRRRAVSVSRHRSDGACGLRRRNKRASHARRRPYRTSARPFATISPASVARYFCAPY